MKLRFLFSLFLMLPLTVAAQLKVNSNGYTSFLTTTNPLSPISINDVGDSDYTVYCKSLAKNGIYCSNNGSNGIRLKNRADSAGTTSRYGIYCQTGSFDYTSLSGKNIGVFGIALNSNNVFGVVGKLFHAGRGAAYGAHPCRTAALLRRRVKVGGTCLSKG